MGWEVRLISFEVSERVATERTRGALILCGPFALAHPLPRLACICNIVTARMIWLFGWSGAFLLPRRRKTTRESNRIAIINGIAGDSSFRSIIERGTLWEGNNRTEQRRGYVFIISPVIFSYMRIFLPWSTRGSRVLRRTMHDSANRNTERQDDSFFPPTFSLASRNRCDVD